MAKFVHYITVPVTLCVDVVVETDTPINENEKAVAYKLAMQIIDKADVRFVLKTSGEHKDDVNISDQHSIDFYQTMIDGNFCHVTYPEIFWETEENEDE